MGTRVFLQLRDALLEASACTLHEGLGTVFEANVELILPERTSTSGLVGAPCAVLIGGERRVVGIVERVATFGASSTGHRYAICVRSSLQRLALRTRSRVFQQITAPDLVQRVLTEGGVRVSVSLREAYEPREYVVQYTETDLAFVRRLCEEDGLFLRSTADDDGEIVVIADSSSSGPRVLGGAIAVGEPAGLHDVEPIAWDFRTNRRRRTGAVTVRDHDCAHPTLQLEGVAKNGSGHERSLEVYVAPGGFKTPQAASRSARLALEALRAEATLITFRANTTVLAPGSVIRLEPLAEEFGVEREVFIIETTLRYARNGAFEVSVKATPSEVPYRLARQTPKPRIAGVHPALVTGPKGQEIHPDELGRVRVRFFWDREGPLDHGSSLPVRVLQPNLGGSMLIPRVGWEVMVAFEDGDPDRPYVLGRVYNAKQQPPFGLPANKTTTCIGTRSSPGGGRENRLHFDDGAGRQHFAMHAGFGKSTTVGGNQNIHTGAAESWSIGGAHKTSVGANDTISVKTALVTTAATQTVTVGASQKVAIGGDLSVHSGTEKVIVGAALTELVGSVGDGLHALSVSVALHDIGEIPVVGHFASAAVGTAIAAKHAYDAGGAEAAARAVDKGAIDFAFGEIPGGDSVVAAAEATGKMPWAPDPEKNNEHRTAAGPSAAKPGPASAGATGGGGNRIVKTGKMLELVGAAVTSIGPASIRWTTAGSQTLALGGFHNVVARNVHTRVAGLQTDNAPSLDINAAFIGRGVTRSLSRTCGAATYNAGGNFGLHSDGPLSIDIGGSLSLEGAKVTFVCGSSVVAISSGGLLVKATTVELDDAAQTSGKEAAP